MNCLHHIVYWLFPSGAAVAEWVAAIATGCLVGAGFIQLKAIRKGAEEQRQRWRREDAIRAEENKPKAAFGFSDCLKCNLKLSCANLGTVGFLVTGMQILPLLGDREKILFGKAAEIFVPVGEEKQVTFDAFKYREVHNRLTEILNAPLRSRHLGIKLILQGPVETAETNLEAYRVHQYPDDGRSLYSFNSWRTIAPPVQGSDRRFDGVPKNEFVTCPKCKNPYTVDLAANLGIVFPVGDCGTVFEAGRNKMADVTRVSVQSCPTHTLPKVEE